MALTTVTLFVTKDGKKFDNELDAQRHEASVALKEELDTYVNLLSFRAGTEKGLKLSQNRVKRILTDFLVWRDTGLVPTAEPAEDAEPAEATA